MLKQISNLILGILCLVNPFISSAQTDNGQNKKLQFKDIQGRWLVVDKSMKDGSCILSISGMPQNTDIEYFFKGREELIICDLARMESNSIKIGMSLGKMKYIYLGEVFDLAMNGDTLLLSEYKEGATPDHLIQIKLVRRDILMKEHSPTYFHDTLLTDVYTRPIFDGRFTNHIWGKINVRNDYEITLKGIIYINRTEKKVHTVLLEKEGMEKSIEKQLLRIIRRTYKKWTFLSDAEIYQIPFYGDLMLSPYSKGGGISFGEEKEVKPVHKPLGGTWANHANSERDFTKAVEAFELENYIKAIHLFESSYKLNPMNIDALYNAANLYLALNNITKACEIWTYLSVELKQVPARKLLVKHCK